jgi:hypothetical protein
MSRSVIFKSVLIKREKKLCGGAVKFNLRVPTLFICFHRDTRCVGALMEHTHLEYYFITLRHTTIVNEFMNDSKQMGQ